MKDREEKLIVISQIKRGEQTVEIWRNVRHAYHSVHTIHDNVDRIKESAKSGTKLLV